MAAESTIEWTEATWSPVTGCSVLTPGCKHCYAMRLAGTRLKHHPSRKGLTEPTKAGPVWTGEVRFNKQWLDQPLRWTKPRRVFVVAHGDLFHANVPTEWIDQVWAIMGLSYVMRDEPHVFQVLTKRAARMQQYFAANPLPRIAALMYNAIYEQGKIYSTGHRNRGIGNRLTGQNMAAEKEGGECQEKQLWPIPLPSPQSGIQTKARLFAGFFDPARNAGRSKCPSPSMDLFQRPDSSQDDNQPPERNKGRQQAEESRTSHNVRPEETRARNSTRQAAPAEGQQASQDQIDRRTGQRNSQPQKPGHDGQGYCNTLRDEAQGNIGHMSAEDMAAYLTWPFPNIWLGVSVENQKAADERLPLLGQTLATIRWVSAEPLLGKVILPEEAHLDWLVCGGESGPGWRPMDPEWARSLRRQCQRRGIAFFMKQMAGKREIPPDLLVREYPALAA